MEELRTDMSLDWKDFQRAAQGIYHYRSMFTRMKPSGAATLDESRVFVGATMDSWYTTAFQNYVAGIRLPLRKLNKSLGDRNSYLINLKRGIISRNNTDKFFLTGSVVLNSARYIRNVRLIFIMGWCYSKRRVDRKSRQTVKTKRMSLGNNGRWAN